MNSANEKRRGLTLVELLVVIAIIGVLIGLLLPAVQAARESMHSSACANNIRQIAIATQAHHDANRKFPFGQITMNSWEVFTDGSDGPYGSPGKVRKKDRRIWMHLICPFMELTQVYDKVITAVTTDAQWPYQLSIATKQYPAFMCPSDPNKGKICYYYQNTNGTTSTRGFCGNYLACASSGSFGSTGGGGDLNGIFFAKSAVKIAEVTDGLSKTVMFAEGVVVPDPLVSPFHDARGLYFNASFGETLFSTRYQPNTSVGDGLPVRNWPPKAPTGSTSFVQYTRSWHSGGVNVAMADGSTRFVTDTVDAAVWTASGSRNGSEPTRGID
jgi:prepilin-type N-terminal cleavage/methylation domain-containing protein/prepilin-type processing-associated H-X9-DG protein